MRRILPTLVVLFVAVPVAHADWSARQQLTGYLGTPSPVVALTDDGTRVLALVASTGPDGPGRYLTKLPSGGPLGRTNLGTGTATWAVSRSGAALLTWSDATSVWAQYVAADGTAGAATKIGDEKAFDGPIPLINDAGAAAVVWSRRNTATATDPLTTPNEIVAATTTGVWPVAPTVIATISRPNPSIPENPPGSGSYAFQSCTLDLRAAILPGGTPLVAWSDAYGSWHQTVDSGDNGSVDSDAEWTLCSVRAAMLGGSVQDVTPRPSAGFYAAPVANRPEFTPVSLTTDPVSGSAVLLTRGLDDSLSLADDCDVPGVQNLNACRRVAREVRFVGGGSTSLTGPGATLGTSVVAAVGMRGDRTALAVSGTSTPLKAGVGTGVPTLTTLNDNRSVNAGAVVVGADGGAHLALGSGAGMYVYDAAPASSTFAEPPAQLDDSSGAMLRPGVASDCAGGAVAAWSRDNGQVFFAQTTGAPAVCGSPTPTPTATETATPTATATPSPTATVTVTPTPVPALRASLSGSKKQAAGKTVSVTVTCSRPCTATATGSLVVPKAKTYALTRAKATFTGAKTLKVGVPKKARKAAAKALRKGRKPKAKLTIRLTGVGQPLTRTVTLSR